MNAGADTVTNILFSTAEKGFLFPRLRGNGLVWDRGFLTLDGSIFVKRALALETPEPTGGVGLLASGCRID